jgi:shikimate kinase
MTRIILVGFMGAGKTTLGRKLAETLNIPFFDSDQEIEKESQMKIKDLFEQHGELFFREKEKEFIQSLFMKTNFVLATGGGLPCYNNQMNELNVLGTTVYLNNSVEIIIQRLLNDNQHRPLIKDLTEKELSEYISAKMKDREPTYLRSKLVLQESDQQVDALISQLGFHRKS